MVEATLTPSSRAPLPGTKRGSCTAQNGYTSKFGFSTLEGVNLTPDTDTDCIATVTISGGQATINLIDDEGNAITATTTLYYSAWGE